MNFLINIVAVPLGFIMRLIYGLVGNYGIAIILFTLVTKLILFPISYKQQKNSARLQLINPKLKKLQERYKDKPEKLQLEQSKLYQDENINPYSSCLTSFIPLILLWGVLAVVYKPMTYIMRYDKDVIEEAKSIVISIDEDAEKTQDTLKRNSMRQELIIVEKLEANMDGFLDAINAGEVTYQNKDGEDVFVTLTAIEPEFVTRVDEFADTFKLGNVNLSETPSTKPSENSHFFLFLIPILSGLMQLAMTIYMQYMQKKRNPDMPNMGAMNAMLFLMPLFSVWLAFTVPAGVGFYWLCSSAFSFLQSILLYAWFNEKRVEQIGAQEREKAKKKKRRPSMMQMMLEQQQEMLREKEGGSAAGVRLGGGPANRVRYSDDDEPEKLSRSEMEEYQTSVIRDARRRIAEKYGDTEALAQEENARSQSPKKKKK
ncbi:MAG: YidC/Oxa1 family membrane protein insertase [Oscillospiraceae bacterium]|nr:YidC/Oxa1 family membrane protein insertase [Oscillospiraceae bacterium]